MKMNLFHSESSVETFQMSGADTCNRGQRPARQSTQETKSSQTHQNCATTKLSCGRIHTSRIIFLSALCIIAACLCVGAHQFVVHADESFAKEQFDAIAERALGEALETTIQKSLGPATLATMAAQTFPDAEEWPTIRIKGFEAISKNVIDVSEGRSMGLLPLVDSEHLEEFEAFAYDVFEELYPGQEVGVSSFGKGVYSVDPSLENVTDLRYHDTDGLALWGSPYDVIAPFMYHSLGSSILMWNLHSYPTFGKAMDDMITCSNEQARLSNEEQGSAPMGSCTTLSDMLLLRGKKYTDVTTPGAIIMEPIYPENNKTTLTGLISSTLVWDEVFDDLFSTEVSGVDVVLSTETQVYTYEIDYGEVNFIGEGDLHDTVHDAQVRTITLNNPGLFSNQSASYTLSLYPKDSFLDSYSTFPPVLAIVGALCVMLLTSILFLLYDYFVREEIEAKREIIEAKRQFVRFISHEVRTPLNAVILGVKLLQDEFRTFQEKIHIQDGLDGERSHAEEGLDGPSPESPGPNINKTLSDWLEQSQDVLLSAESAVSVLSDLLNFDKIKSGKLSLEAKLIPIWTLLEECTAEFRLQALKEKVDLKLDLSALLEEDASIDPEVPASKYLPVRVRDLKVVGDETRITQVFRNLISNGLKFTPEGGYLTICPRWDEMTGDDREETDILMLDNGDNVPPFAGTLAIDVIDTGAGMTLEQLGKLFGDGTQFNANALQGGRGSGLGLFISKGIVEKHGGSLTASSEGLDCGTTFTLRLPLHADDTGIDEGPIVELNGADSFQNPESEANPCENLSLLVVDDAALNRKLLVRMLKKDGNHTCEEAEDGMFAVEKVKAAMAGGKSFDAILMDSEMPRLSGPLAAKQIRELGCDSLIVGITGNIFPEDIQFFKENGANVVLPKPMNMSAFVEAWMEYGISSDLPRKASPVEVLVC